MSTYRDPFSSRHIGPFGPIRPLTPAIKALLIANCAVFAFQFLVGFFSRLGLIPPMSSYYVERILAFSIDLGLKRFCVWQLVTYMFVHGGLWHLALNMFILWMFGRKLEERWGSREFLRYYFFCGIGAALVHAILSLAFLGGERPLPGDPSIMIPTPAIIGASGAVYGLLLANAVYWGSDIVLVYFVIPMKMRTMMIILMVFVFLGSIEELAGVDSSGIANVAHLGGLLTGWLYIKFNGWRALTARLPAFRNPFRRGPRMVRRPRQTRRRGDSRPPRRPSMDDDTWR